MASISLRADSRIKKDGTKAILLTLRTNGRKIDFQTGVTCINFDNLKLIPKSDYNFRAKNARLLLLKARLENYLLMNDHLSSNISELKKEVLKEVFDREDIKLQNTFLDYLDKFVSLKTNKGTISVYKTTKNLISEFDLNCTLESINKDWLMRFDKWLDSRNCCLNYRSIQLRNIRAVFNYCIDEEITTLYPFRRFQIKTEETRKRSITVEQLRELRDYDVEAFQERYRDIFMLIFYLIGINIGDLCLLRPGDLKNGRIEFYRLKTHRLYSIKVEPEAMAIINKYRGKDYLLNIMDEYTDYSTFRGRINKELKRIGECKRVGLGGRKIIIPLMKFLSTYWARHSWATMAAYLDIPKEVIAASLGHVQDSVTDIYIKLDPRKVDKANRKVIDYLNGTFIPEDD